MVNCTLLQYLEPISLIDYIGVPPFVFRLSLCISSEANANNYMVAIDQDKPQSEPESTPNFLGDRPDLSVAVMKFTQSTWG
jgi:hypothetical protein